MPILKENNSSLWINHGFVTHHFDRKQNFNERNLGLGIEYHMDDNTSIYVGRFKNSQYHYSNYLNIGYHPFHYHGFKFGAVAGVINGYKGFNHTKEGRYLPMAAPFISYEYKNIGFNLLLIPEVNWKKYEVDGAIALQFKLKLY